MTAQVAHLVRHPIKSAGFETVERATLTRDAAFPFDRLWAVAHAAARLSDPLAWAPKLNFLRGWGSAELMAVSCTSDPEAGAVTLSHPRRPTETFRPDDAPDAARLIDWLRPLWSDTRPEPARVIRVPGQAMTDQDQPLVSINSLSSLADLAARLGQDLSIHRFRGNIWVAGWAPWQELAMIGQEITLGSARLRVEEPVGRCQATGANPETGAFDADIMAALEGHFGHTDFGVFARVIEGGTVALGDTVRTWA
ncbi:MOSC domain-containing protein [Rhodobacter sp. Har01]|uniref:MOSC domain-containing protein n=1 Tax=Rhodobacter sp. Har01 TaxID=2883999 RepID=UPI001D067633|nr:MOSC domain-containing protein [Rhodobacter sp. Har01]MCB6180024.1 MOSC domain-containing protein [Rhodobacter sp. Har01]